jgi:hypothetical protein
VCSPEPGLAAPRAPAAITKAAPAAINLRGTIVACSVGRVGVVFVDSVIAFLFILFYFLLNLFIY